MFHQTTQKNELGILSFMYCQCGSLIPEFDEYDFDSTVDTLINPISHRPTLLPERCYLKRLSVR